MLKNIVHGSIDQVISRVTMELIMLSALPRVLTLSPPKNVTFGTRHEIIYFHYSEHNNRSFNFTLLRLDKQHDNVKT